MVVRSNINAMYSNRNLRMNNNEVATSLKKLASGYQINSAADDTSGCAVSEKMSAQITGLEQGTENAVDGLSLVQTAEGCMGEIHDMLNRMVELATKSANGTIEDEIDREIIQVEVDVFCHEIDRIATSANFNGITLFDGSLAAIRQTGEILSSGYDSNDEIIGGGLIIHVGETGDGSHKVPLYIDELSVSGLGLETIDVSTQEGSGAAMSAIQEAIDKVSINRSNLGAISNRFEYSIKNNQNNSENMTAARSVIRDSNMASEMMDYTRMNVLTQASQSMLAHSNQNLQSILELMG